MRIISWKFALVERFPLSLPIIRKLERHSTERVEQQLNSLNFLTNERKSNVSGNGSCFTDTNQPKCCISDDIILLFGPRSVSDIVFLQKLEVYKNKKFALFKGLQTSLCYRKLCLMETLRLATMTFSTRWRTR